MSGGLSRQRKREIGRVGLLVVGLVVTTSFVATMMDRAWESEGIGFAAAHWLSDAFGVHIDVVVAVPVGIVVGWLLLLALDRSKRIQAPAILLLSTVFVGILLLLGRFWIVDWRGQFPIVVTGAVVAAAVASAPALRSGRIEFPIASVGLYTVALALVAFGLVDAFLLGGWGSVGPGTVADTAVGVLSIPMAVAFVALVGHFVEYRDQRRVAVVSRNRGTDGSGTAVATGLTKHVQTEYDGRLISGARTVGTVPGQLRSGNDPAPLSESITVEYKSPQLISRWITVSASPVDASDSRAIDAAAGTGGGSGDVRAAVDRIAALLFAPYLEVATRLRSGDSRTARLQRTVENADVVVFVVSASDYVPSTERPDEIGLTDLEPPEYVETMRQLSDELPRETRRVLAVYDAAIAWEVYANEARGYDATRVDLDDRRFVDALERTLGDDFYFHELVALDATVGEELVAGVDRLRYELDYGYES